MSESHFHRVFKSITVVTPRAYASAHRAERVRQGLASERSITSAALKAGFNSSGRFYESSPKILGMKPAAFRAGGAGATIRFAIGKCSLGAILVAATERGVCFIALGDDPDALLHDLQKQFARAKLIGGDRTFKKVIGQVIAFVERPAAGLNLPLDIQGTAFQQRVWRKLYEIPAGATKTYAQIAQSLGAPRSTRAVARACATNPLSLAIPCHRVIRGDGALAGYRWGIARKAELLRREKDMTRG